jgi:hypothetical protein
MVGALMQIRTDFFKISKKGLEQIRTNLKRPGQITEILSQNLARSAMSEDEV